MAVVAVNAAHTQKTSVAGKAIAVRRYVDRTTGDQCEPFPEPPARCWECLSSLLPPCEPSSLCEACLPCESRPLCEPCWPRRSSWFALCDGLSESRLLPAGGCRAVAGPLLRTAGILILLLLRIARCAGARRSFVAVGVLLFPALLLAGMLLVVAL